MTESSPGRNDPCPCGSGRKYKVCCLESDREAANIERALVPETPEEVRWARKESLWQVELIPIPPLYKNPATRPGAVLVMAGAEPLWTEIHKRPSMS